MNVVVTNFGPVPISAFASSSLHPQHAAAPAYIIGGAPVSAFASAAAATSQHASAFAAPHLHASGSHARWAPNLSHSQATRPGSGNSQPAAITPRNAAFKAVSGVTGGGSGGDGESGSSPSRELGGSGGRGSRQKGGPLSPQTIHKEVRVCVHQFAHQTGFGGFRTLMRS